MVADTTQGQDPYILWCEFSELMHCAARFRGDDEAGWIQHHQSHLRDEYPAQVVCWFCDPVPFVARSTAERRANFEERMLHIRSHIIVDYKHRHHMRPDFRMIRHLYERGLLDESVYRRAMRASELPAALRLPGGDDGEWPDGAGARAAEVGEVYDLEKERREARRREGRTGQRRRKV